MRILYVLPSLQHPTIVRGGLRHHHFLRALSRRHAITLLALGRAEATDRVRAEIGALVERLLVFPVDEPATPQATPRAGGRAMRAARRLGRELRERRAIRAMRSAFRELARRERFDVVLFHGKLVYPVIQGFDTLPIVADFCDATSMRLREQLRLASGAVVPWRWWRYRAARRLERALLAQARHVAFISPRDRAAVLGADSLAPVIPNGIDLAYWTRDASGAQPNVLVFTGVMSYAPNEDAALYLMEYVLPAIRATRRDVELLIVGRDPTPAVVAAAARVPGVTVTGWVDDVRPYLQRACVYVAPLRFASGLQNKILEALAMEVPVVTTPVVVDGLRVDGGAEPPVRSAEGAADLAAAVLARREDVSERRRLADAGRRFVEAEFDWEREAERLEAMCEAAAGQASRPAGRRPQVPVLAPEHA